MHASQGRLSRYSLLQRTFEFDLNHPTQPTMIEVKLEKEFQTSTLAVLKRPKPFGSDPVNMILFHILMFSQNSTFYIYIIYCQNAPRRNGLLCKNCFSLERWSPSPKKKISHNGTRKPREPSKKCKSKFPFSMGWVDKCFCVCVSRLNRNCTFIDKL